MAPRDIDKNFAIGQSKAARNAIVKAMPPGLVATAIDAAKLALGELEKEQHGGIREATERAVKKFNQWGIKLPQLEAYVGKSFKTWTEEDLGKLRAARETIEDGEQTPEEIFDPAAAAKDELLDAKPASGGEHVDADGVVTNPGANEGGAANE
jgi:hypothetical protein